jgi:hypothetical protein
LEELGFKVLPIKAIALLLKIAPLKVESQEDAAESKCREERVNSAETITELTMFFSRADREILR